MPPGTPGSLGLLAACSRRAWSQTPSTTRPRCSRTLRYSTGWSRRSRKCRSGRPFGTRVRRLNSAPSNHRPFRGRAGRQLGDLGRGVFSSPWTQLYMIRSVGWRKQTGNKGGFNVGGFVRWQCDDCTAMLLTTAPQARPTPTRRSPGRTKTGPPPATPASCRP